MWPIILTVVTPIRTVQVQSVNVLAVHVCYTSGNFLKTVRELQLLQTTNKKSYMTCPIVSFPMTPTALCGHFTYFKPFKHR